MKYLGNYTRHIAVLALATVLTAAPMLAMASTPGTTNPTPPPPDMLTLIVVALSTIHLF